MATELHVRERIKEYERTYRNPNLPAFEVSEKYSLFPDRNTPSPKWPEQYPNGDKPGVYLIFGKKVKLLYVGKASLNNILASRLGAYFAYENDRKTCKIKHGDSWSEPPQYLITVSVTPKTSFEAPALEEFLIKQFEVDLPDNRRGTIDGAI